MRIVILRQTDDKKHQEIIAKFDVLTPNAFLKHCLLAQKLLFPVAFIDGETGEVVKDPELPKEATFD